MSTPLTEEQREKTRVTTMRMSHIVYGQLRAYCKANGKQMHWVVSQAISDYLVKVAKRVGR